MESIIQSVTAAHLGAKVFEYHIHGSVDSVDRKVEISATAIEGIRLHLDRVPETYNYFSEKRTSEASTAKWAKHIVVSGNDLKKGDALNAYNLSTVRISRDILAQEIPAWQFHRIDGREMLCDLDSNLPVRFDHLGIER